MNIPVSWLKEAANINDSTTTLIEKMVSAGNAVDGLTKLGEDITGVVVGRIVSLERHPDADKLWITNVDTGSQPLQIITGADNLKVGDFVPVALHGSTLANGLKIKKGKMRGLDSNGMLCSIEELGYTVADYPEACADGIYVFPNAQEIGVDVKPIMQLCEEVADFDILSNRPDTNSVMGLAREAAAVYGHTFELPKINVKQTGDGHASDLVTVEIQDNTRCPRYIARIVKNVKIAPSPQWLRRRLTNSGIRPINNIVDITNYVMLEYGQPLHAFDISAVAIKDGKHNIIVRTANPGEVLKTLDEEEHKLTDTTLLIADCQKAIGIAGVMGGENSKITDATSTILFESANFDSANIRQTSRALGMRTDASGRYEKGQDPNQAEISVSRAMELVEMLACGDVVPGAVDCYPNSQLQELKTIAFKPCSICALLGVDTANLGAEQICSYLNRVGIITKDCGTYMEATIPTYRRDIAGEADLAEEVARFYGLNNIPSRYTQVLGNSLQENEAGKSPRRRRVDKLKTVATSLGYNEALTYPFESPKVFDKLNIPIGHELRLAPTLKNPLGEDFSIMRTVTIGGLLESIARNYKKGNDRVALFEVSDTYSYDISVKESKYLTLISYGQDTGYLSVKGDVEAIISAITTRPLVFEPSTNLPFMHPGRTASVGVKVNPNPRDAAMPVGIVGELHPAVTKNYDISTRVQVAILDMLALHQVAEAYKFKFVNPPVFPALARDLAFKVAENVPAASLEAAIREKGGQLLADVSLFDVYQGVQVGEGFKSMAYSLKFRASDRTLTVPDVQKSLDAILANLQTKFGAEIRG